TFAYSSRLSAAETGWFHHYTPASNFRVTLRCLLAPYSRWRWLQHSRVKGRASDMQPPAVCGARIAVVPQSKRLPRKTAITEENGGAFVPGAKGPSVPKTCLRRYLFTIGPGPDTGDSRPRVWMPPYAGEIRDGWGRLCTSLPSRWHPYLPQARVVTAAANIIDERKSRCLCMATSPMPGTVIRRSHAGSFPTKLLMSADKPSMRSSRSSGHGCLRLKYRKSGGGWSLRVGISLPSALRK